VLRALQSDLTLNNDAAYLNSIPFSGLAFETDDACGEISVIFCDKTITCKVIVNWKSYSNGKSSGEFKPLSLEQKYGFLRLITADEFPDDALNCDAVFEDGRPVNGIIYETYPKGTWGARMYTAGNEDLDLLWHANGTLAYAAGHGPVREVFAWDQTGLWEECCISPLDAGGGSFSIKLQADQRVTVLVMRNWKAAVSDRRRLTSYQFAEKLQDILRFHAGRTCTLAVDRDFINAIPLVIDSGFLDDTETIYWDGDDFDVAVGALLEHLSKKNLTEVHLSSSSEASGAFALSLRRKLSNIKIASAALYNKDVNKL